MQPDRLHEQRLRSLDFWRGAVELEAIPGGITNRNFRVRKADGRTFVARLCDDLPHLGIDRRSELASQRVAWSLGIAPAVAHHEPGILVSEHVDGRTLAPGDLGEPDRLGRVARLLRELHDSWDRVDGLILYFSPFQTVRTYARTARDLGARLPSGIDATLEDARSLSRRIGPYTPALCHNDLLAANWIEAPDGTLKLVDWEYAGVGHPLFDLANVASNADFDADREEAFLRSYRGGIDPHELLQEFRIFRAVSSLRESLWAFIQSVASDLDFDYHAYARQHLDAYRQAREDLARMATS